MYWFTWGSPNPVFYRCIFCASITNNTTCSQNSRNNRRIWGRLAAPVVAYSEKKYIRISYANWGSRHSGREDDDDVDADEDAVDDADADDVDDDVDDDAVDDADGVGGQEGRKEEEHSLIKI